MNKKHNKSFLRNYYLTSFFYDFIFAYAIYTIFFNIRGGLSVFQISVLLSWWAMTAVLLEIPSGALADYWSRKWMLVIAPLIKGLCFIVWFFANGNFYFYGLGFLFWSIGSSLISGTTEAILYDHLKSVNMEDKYEKILGRKKFYFHIALGVSIVSGGFIAHYNLDLPIILSIIPLILSSFFALLLKAPAKIKSTNEIKYIEYIKLAYKEVRSNKTLFILLLYSFGISIMGDVEEFDQLYYKLVNLPVYAFGIVGFIWSMLNSIACFYAYKLKNISWTHYIFPFVTSTLLILVGIFPSIPMIGVLLLAHVFTTPMGVLIDSKIQHNIQSASRATVTSISSLLICLLGVILTPIFGLLSKFWGLYMIYLSAALFYLILTVFSFYKRKTFINNPSKEFIKE